MSMMYCDKHDRHYDSDFITECPDCEHEPICCHLQCEAKATWEGWNTNTSQDMTTLACDDHLGHILSQGLCEVWPFSYNRAPAVQATVEELATEICAFFDDPGYFTHTSVKEIIRKAVSPKAAGSWVEACKNAGYWDMTKAKSYNAYVPGPYAEAFKAGFHAASPPAVSVGEQEKDK